MIKHPCRNNGKDNTIPVGIAKKMTAAFRESQKTERGTFTEAAWFPAAQINQLAEKVAKFEGDGVRVYFGRYTDEIIDTINKLGYGDQIPRTYTNMNTVIFVVTKNIDGKPRTDYFINNVSHRPHDKIALQNVIGDPAPTDPDNRGDLCPEMCSGGSALM